MDLTRNVEWLLNNIDRKPFKRIANRLPEILDSFLRYDLHFMRVTGVLDENDQEGQNEYDEDEAFEFIYDAYLSDHPQDGEDEDMMIASLLNAYMELQADYE
ncbi:MAG: hypothetical protein E7319_06130 [Clostridiales bacterium]|nr:hypothetical protein [Clostridiales bacterium]